MALLKKIRILVQVEVHYYYWFPKYSLCIILFHMHEDNDNCEIILVLERMKNDNPIKIRPEMNAKSWKSSSTLIVPYFTGRLIKQKQQIMQ